jgi:hypothetical protein
MENNNLRINIINKPKLYLLLFLITQLFSANCQNLIINDTIYKRGIYKNFEEFKYNKPSTDFNYEITTEEIEYGLGGFDEGFRNTTVLGKVTYYKILIKKSVGISIGNVFGFCDGESIYINTNLPILKPNTKFTKIEFLGAYCYFKDTYCPIIQDGYSRRHCSLNEKIIKIYDGEVILLNADTVQKLIEDNIELTNEFNRDTRKNKKLKEYIILYNAKY